jgi:quinol monooxygenase YgiN
LELSQRSRSRRARARNSRRSRLSSSIRVNENEKGCLLYQLYHGEAPNTYVFMERYADQAAVEAHRSTEYFKTLGRAMAEFMDGKPTIQRFKQVGA